MIYTHVAAAVVALAVGFGAAWKTQAWRHDSFELERVQKLESQNKRQVRSMDKASAGYEGDRGAARTKFKTITKEVERVVEKTVYRDMCLDSDGLQLIERAIRPDASTGEPAGTVPRSDEPN